MSERPILFSGPMVRAILEGRKTQTRRPVKIPPEFTSYGGTNIHGEEVFYSHDDAIALKSSFGLKGDRLWVRETWHHEKGNDFENAAFDNGTLVQKDGKRFNIPDWRPHAPIWKKRPSIHMPRWASRIDLEITNIRVERLQDISLKDIYAEGVIHGIQYEELKDVHPQDRHKMKALAFKEFQELWDSLNNARAFGWDVNPWVWVIEFRRVRP